MNIHLRFFLIISIIMFAVSGHSQNFAVKTNLLYDAAMSINLGLEFTLGENTTLDISANYNPWVLDKTNNSKIKHVLVQPEFRYWLCTPFNGHFFGFHTHFAEYNIAGNNWFTRGVKAIYGNDLMNYRHEGWNAGAGFSYGYHWMINTRWGIETTVGVGYAYIDYDKYNCETCGSKVESGNRHYFGPTKLGITLVFLIR